MGLFSFFRKKNETRKATCPQCDEPLFLEKYEGQEIDRCKMCRGVWLDGGELQKIIETKDEQFDSRFVVKMKVLAQWRSSNENAKTSDRSCVRCGKKMVCFNYAGIAGLVLERCDAGCGLWLDQNELEKVQVYEENK